MSELYWVTRLLELKESLEIFAIVCIVAAIIIALAYFISDGDAIEEDTFKRWVKRLGASVFISLLFCVFIPDRKDMYMIFGLGGTIDYIKQNDIVKQIPDKCIQALDVWVGELLEDKKE